MSTFSFGVYRADKERFHDKLTRVAHLISCWAEMILPLTVKLEAIIAKSTHGTSEEVSQTLYEGLRTFPGVGPFNAYQVAVDVGYWRRDLFDEDVFTVAGPGAINGVKLCFESYTFPSTKEEGKTTTKKTWERQKDEKVEMEKQKEKEVDTKRGGGKRKRKIRTKKRTNQPKPPYERLIAILVDEVNTRLLSELGGISPAELFYDRPKDRRRLNLMSMENCMCELSKYARETGRNGRCRYPGSTNSGKKKQYQSTSALFASGSASPQKKQKMKIER